MQEAERIKFVVTKAEQERKAAVIRAEGEAEAAEMVHIIFSSYVLCHLYFSHFLWFQISLALRDHGSGLIEVRRIDSSKEIATTLAKSRNVTYIPNGGANMLLNLPVAAS